MRQSLITVFQSVLLLCCVVEACGLAQDISAILSLTRHGANICLRDILFLHVPVKEGPAIIETSCFTHSMLAKSFDSVALL